MIGPTGRVEIVGIEGIEASLVFEVNEKWRAKVSCLKKSLTFCQQGLTLKNEWMTLSRTLRRMYHQGLTDLFSQFELNS